MIGDGVVINKGASASIFAYGIPQSGNQAYATKGSTTINGVWTTIGQNSGFLISPINELGTWTVHAIRDGVERITTVLVDAAEMYDVNTYSRLPAGYTEVEWIKSTDYQYIDTGVVVNTLINPVIFSRMKFTTAAGTYALCGSGDSSQAFQWGMWISNGNLTGNIVVNNNNKGYFGTLTQGVFHDLYCENGKQTADGIQTDTMQYGDVSSNSKHITLFGRSETGVSVQYFPHAEGEQYLKSNGQFVYHFIPCHNSSNVVGMYDLVSNTFFTNAGTGVFVAGPEVVA